MKSAKQFAINAGKTLILPVSIVLLFGILTGGRTLNLRVFEVTARQAIIPALMAMAMMGNMTLGVMDFSVGAVAIASAIIGGNLMNLTGWGIPGMILFCVLTGVLLTSLTGFLNNKLRVPTLVLTVGMVLVYETLPRLFFASGVKVRMKFLTLASPPYCFIVLAVMFVIFYILHNKTTYGHNIRALGGNEDIAKSAGLNIPSIKFQVFLVSGIFLGIAGVLHLSNSGQVENAADMSSAALMFDGLMCVFMGRFLSRYCNVAVGILIGAFCYASLSNGFVAMGLSAAIKTIATGVFLMGLLSISANQGRLKQLRADKERARKANEMYLQGLSNRY